MSDTPLRSAPPAERPGQAPPAAAELATVQASSADASVLATPAARPGLADTLALDGTAPTPAADDQTQFVGEGSEKSAADTLFLPDVSAAGSDATRLLEHGQGRIGPDATELIQDKSSVPAAAQTIDLQEHAPADPGQTCLLPEGAPSGQPAGPSVGTVAWTEVAEGQAAAPPLRDLSTIKVEDNQVPPKARGDTATVGLEIAASSKGLGPVQLPGAPVLDGYQVLKELDRGAMGVVYKARQLALNRIVALKMVLAGQSAGPRCCCAFRSKPRPSRLQHPNIVQIYEIGEQNGCPYFALEFVEGGTLSDHIENKEIPPREAAWVVQHLALAMEQAHRSGVVHRDLKPANVLLAPAAVQPNPTAARRLTDFVPKVSDFGLAKRLEDSGQTQAGSILGTPSYMAPEQAEGRNDLVGPSADIYALGAILYDLLTGRPPFQGKTVLETLQQVKKLDPVAPRLLCPRLPHDLDTICLKCLEKAPAKRYQTAQHLAEDLRRFLANEPILARRTPLWERAWKYCKRRPAMAGVAALTVCLLLGLGIGGYVYANVERRHAQKEAGLREDAEKERNQANLQRDLAEARFKDAQDAVDFMLTRIGEERLEHEPRMELVRRDLLEKALHYYERFLGERGDDPSLRLQTAQAFQRSGDIRRLLGQYKEAEQAFNSAIALFEPLTKSAPAVPLYRQDLAAAYVNLGSLLKEMDRQADAAKAYQDASTWQRQLVEQSDPETNEGKVYRQQLAATSHNLAQVQQVQGHPDDALVLLRQALDLQEELCQEHPTPAPYVRDQAGTLGTMAQAYRQLDQVPKAMASLRKSLQLLDMLVPGGKGTPADRRDLARTHTRLAELLEAGNPRQAELEYRQAVELGQALKDDFPTIPEYRQNLAASYNGLGQALLAQGRREQADLALRQGLALKEKLAGDFPRRPDFRRDLANSQINHGVQLLGMQRLADSAAAYRRAEDLLAALVKESPLVPDYQQQWGKALVNRALVLHMANKLKEAEEAYREALDRRKELAEQFAKIPAYRYEWARTEFLLASLRQMRTERQTPAEMTETEKLYRDAIAKLKPLVTANRASPIIAWTWPPASATSASCCGSRIDSTTPGKPSTRA